MIYEYQSSLLLYHKYAVVQAAQARGKHNIKRFGFGSQDITNLKMPSEIADIWEQQALRVMKIGKKKIWKQVISGPNLRGLIGIDR